MTATIWDTYYYYYSHLQRKCSCRTYAKKAHAQGTKEGGLLTSREAVESGASHPTTPRVTEKQAYPDLRLEGTQIPTQISLLLFSKS